MIETIQIDLDKQKNIYLSLILIAVNFLLAFGISVTTKSLGDEFEIIALFFVIPIAPILFGAFAFTYHGKNYRWAKWLFWISLIIALASLCLFFYVMALGKAYRN